MLTQNQKYLARLEQQIKFNQAEAAKLRRELYPEEFGLIRSIKHALSVHTGSKYHLYFERKRQSYDFLVKYSNRLILKQLKLQSN